MITHENALAIGTRLDEYKIKRILGAGGFGITYLAYDVNLLMDVVIKEYLPNYLAVRKDRTTIVPISKSDKEEYEWGMKRFLEEAQTLASFKPRHENIVKIIRFFKKNNTAYFVMEHEEGEDLSSFLGKKDEKLSEDEVKNIILPILDGLKATHDNGILHRDIKPSNIFIRKNGTPLLIDFGSARNAVGEKSKSLSVVVTPGYAPVEQYTTSTKQGSYTDIYSIGAVMYKLVTGQTPIESNDRSMNVYTNEEEDPLVLASIKAKGEYSKSFLEAIDLALKIRPQERPQSVDEFKNLILHGLKPISNDMENTVRIKPAKSKKTSIKKGKNRAIYGIIALGLFLAIFIFSSLSNKSVQTPKQNIEIKKEQISKIEKTEPIKVDENSSKKIEQSEKNETKLTKEELREKILSTEKPSSHKENRKRSIHEENYRLCAKYNTKAKSFIYCQKACKGNNALSCTNLGYLYHNGIGIKKDYKKAREYHLKSCKLKSGLGCSNLGFLYNRGYGVKKSYKEAAKYYKKACNLKSGLGCENLGNLYRYGLGVGKSIRSAKKLYKKGCSFGRKRACSKYKEI